jgi:hypothetical protein
MPRKSPPCQPCCSGGLPQGLNWMPRGGVLRRSRVVLSGELPYRCRRMACLAHRDGRVVVGVAAGEVMVGDYACQDPHHSAIVVRLDLSSLRCDVGVQSFQ